MKSNYKSPLKGEALRYPGQSLDERLDKELDENVVLPLMTIVVLIVLTCSQWVSW